MLDKVDYKFDHDLFMIFVEYELASSKIAPFIFWDWAQQKIAEKIYRRAMKKYKLYLLFLNTKNQIKNEQK